MGLPSRSSVSWTIVRCAIVRSLPYLEVTEIARQAGRLAARSHYSQFSVAPTSRHRRATRTGRCYGLLLQKMNPGHGGDMGTPRLLPADVPSSPVLQPAIARCLARFKATSRTHAESDLRAYFGWWADHRLDPLATARPQGRALRTVDAGV